MNKVFKLSGNKPILSKRFHYPIDVEEHSLALVQFNTTYLTPNIRHENNKLYFIDSNGVENKIEIPIGQYNVEDLEKVIKTIPPFNKIPTDEKKIIILLLNLIKLKIELKLSVFMIYCLIKKIQLVNF